jgi:sugar phosphate isomerase/epimerase
MSDARFGAGARLRSGTMQDLGIEMISFFGMPPVPSVELARDLGCRHISLGLRQMDFDPHGYPRFSLRDPALKRELLAAMDDCGVSISLGEGFLVAPGAESRETWAADLELMAGLGVKRINSVSFEPDRQRNIDQFGLLAETAAGFGIETLVEFVPIFSVPDLPAALDLVRQVGRPDFRILVDTMHVGRTGATAADLAAIDPALIGYIQLCDAPLQPQNPGFMDPDYMDEAMHQRQVPGEGELPLLDMLAALPRDRVIGLEIPLRSEALAGVGPRERLGRCVAAARDLLARLD